MAKNTAPKPLPSLRDSNSPEQLDIFQREVREILRRLDAEATEITTNITNIFGGVGTVTSVTAGSSMVTAVPTTGDVVVDVVPANFTGIPQAGVVNLVTDLSTINTTLATKVDGTGTLNRVPKWTPDGNSLGDSNITDTGALVSIPGSVTLQSNGLGTSTFLGNVTVGSGSLVTIGSATTFNTTAPVLMQSTLSVQGNTSLGNDDSDVTTVRGTLNVTWTSGTTHQFIGSSGNAQHTGNLIVGSSGANTHSLTGALNINSTAGTDGQILGVTGGLPQWGAPSTFSVVDGSGSLNSIPKWTPDGNTLGNSQITDDGTSIQTPIASQFIFNGTVGASIINWTGDANRPTYIRAGETAGAVRIGDINTGGIHLGAASNHVTAYGNLAVNGNATLGDGGADTHTFNGRFTVVPSGVAGDQISSRIGTNYCLTFGSAIDNDAAAAIFHNAYNLLSSSSTPTYKWCNSHGTFGARGIEFGYESGISFYADNAASTADASFTPSRRMLIDNTGTVHVEAALSVTGNCTLGDSASVDTHAINGTTTVNGTSRAQGLNVLTGGSGMTLIDARGLNVSHQPSFDTTAAGAASYAAVLDNNSSRSAGANSLTNVGAYISAAGGQVNYGIYQAFGDNVLNVNGGKTQCQRDFEVLGNCTLGNATSDSHTVTGDLLTQEDVGTTFGSVDGNANLILQDLTGYAAGVGGGLLFRGKYNSGGTVAGGGGIKLMKSNGTDGNFSFDLVLGTRANGAAIAEALRLHDDRDGTFAANLTVTEDITVGDQVITTGIINPDFLAGDSDVNDWNPTGWSDATIIFVRVLANGELPPDDVAITGLAGGVAGRHAWIHYNGATTGSVTFKHNNAGSTAANRFLFPNETDIVLEDYKSMHLVHDGNAWHYLAS